MDNLLENLIDHFEEGDADDKTNDGIGQKFANEQSSEEQSK